MKLNNKQEKQVNKISVLNVSLLTLRKTAKGKLKIED